MVASRIVFSAIDDKLLHYTNTLQHTDFKYGRAQAGRVEDCVHWVIGSLWYLGSTLLNKGIPGFTHHWWLFWVLLWSTYLGYLCIGVSFNRNRSQHGCHGLFSLELLGRYFKRVCTRVQLSIGFSF